MASPPSDIVLYFPDASFISCPVYTEEGKQYFNCDLCGHPFAVTRNRSTVNFNQHRNSDICKRNARRGSQLQRTLSATYSPPLLNTSGPSQATNTSPTTPVPTEKSLPTELLQVTAKNDLTSPPAGKSPTSTSPISAKETPMEPQEATVFLSATSLRESVNEVDNSIENLKSLREGHQTQMNVLDAQLQNLTKKREELTLALQSPPPNFIVRLSPEILNQIFSLILNVPITGTHDGRLTWTFEENANPLWALSHVCQKWRSVILANRTLWSRFNIFIFNDNFATGSHYLAMLAEQLARSQSTPLSLCICSPPTLDVLPQQLLALLLTFMNRVEELFLYIPIPLLSTLSPLRLHFQSLVHLCILNPLRADNWEDEPERDLMVFKQCPKLQKLTTVDLAVPEKMLLPWNNLRQYRCHFSLDEEVDTGMVGPTTDGLRSIMSRAKPLRSCYLELKIPSDSHSAPTRRLTCQNLVDLGIKFYPAYDIETSLAQLSLVPLLGNVIFPCLETLKITTETMEGDDMHNRVMQDESNFASVVDCIERSRCPLRELDFPDGEVAQEDLLRLLRLTPKLERLSLFYFGSVDMPVMLDEIFNQLTFRYHDRPGLAPRLHTLLLTGCMSFSGSIFLKMVRSRWETTPFKEIELGWITTEDLPTEKAELELGLVSNGLKEYCRTGGLKFREEVLDVIELPDW